MQERKIVVLKVSTTSSAIFFLCYNKSQDIQKAVTQVLWKHLAI